jgi:hypothetical protein
LSGTYKFATAEEAVAYVLGKSYQQPLGKAFEISKSYIRHDGSLGVEGWISTPAKDIEKDVIEPESFAGVGLADYMRRGAPVSIEHQTRSLPVGYLQKSRLVRDGKIIQDVTNPKHTEDREDFRYYDGGTGWYALGVIYNEQAMLGISKGVLSSFSWIAMPTDWEDLADGGKHFTKPGSIAPIIETTLTAYPVNTSATMRIAKSRGYRPRIDRQKMVQLLANPLVVDAVVDILVPPGTASAVIEEQLKLHRERAKGR